MGMYMYVHTHIYISGLAVVFLRCLAPRREKYRLEHHTSYIICANRRIKV